MILRRKPPVLAGVAVLLLGVAGVVYGRGGAERFSVQRAPNGEEAVEFYTATRWQRWFGPSGDLVGTVALRRVSDNRLLARSGVFALSGDGEVFWSDDKVQVGTSAVYVRESGDWKILQQ